MSKKYFAFLVVSALVLAAAVMALPEAATASQLLGITITPTPTTPTNTPTPVITVTEEPPPPTETPEAPTPTDVTQPPQETPKPKATELVLLPETGEFPIDPAQGIQWFFALSMIFLIGVILFRTFRTARIKK
jgi:outer membrane biosynthesis protein TonB